jgi:hypothetical protein
MSGAWNRLVGAYEDDGDGLLEPGLYKYNWGNRQIEKVTSVCGPFEWGQHCYYTQNWRVVEDRDVSGHQPPTAMTLPGQSQLGYPHCDHCFRVQGGEVRAWQQ